MMVMMAMMMMIDHRSIVTGSGVVPTAVAVAVVIIERLDTSLSDLFY